MLEGGGPSLPPRGLSVHVQPTDEMGWDECVTVMWDGCRWDWRSDLLLLCDLGMNSTF